MSEERETHKNWDRDEWAAEGTGPDAPEGETWDRTQMEVDDGEGDRTEDPRDPTTADDSGPLTGGGHPSGESHWERSENE
jgi:hypothetical protein